MVKRLGAMEVWFMGNEKFGRKIVVKFGGSSLADYERLSKAVAAVVKEAAKGTKIAVVVSAMGKTTDLLLSTAKNSSNGKLAKHELDDILSMGERTSVRIFAAALRTNGVESRYFDPLDEDWPIITDAAFSNANPILDECRERTKKNVLPLIEQGVVPVIAGFVGRTRNGQITTLGRGGSDTTAFILADALQADEVILVTDADGIMSGDPKLVANPKRLSEIEVGTLVALADSGAKFIHSKALKYKPKSINVRVINHAHGDLDQVGTVITGALATELDVEIANSSPVAEITVVGRKLSENPQIISEFIEKVKEHSKMLGMSMNTNSVILYVSQEHNIEELFKEIHNITLSNAQTIAMAVKRDVAFLKVSGVGLEETHGIIGRISETLRVNEINIYGILTITSSILLFVDWNEREKALQLIKNSLRKH
ncbi:MAG: aspartate kinase [Candidatus Bathyarchaeota archaeon]|nr:aspartate kinase [Candidatus Bathyarchaeota archaeon]